MVPTARVERALPSWHLCAPAVTAGVLFMLGDAVRDALDPKLR
ncbi:hypothetical protein QQY66_31935 [Streptomyces sp. DG2A-72]|nr:hypothetical protein [Streptomyces sp. DG2A-72]MDO0936086.1 hypothetical protein [Streptomyces sp. DG2A-72]